MRRWEGKWKDCLCLLLIAVATGLALPNPTTSQVDHVTGQPAADTVTTDQLPRLLQKKDVVLGTGAMSASDQDDSHALALPLPVVPSGSQSKVAGDAGANSAVHTSMPITKTSHKLQSMTQGELVAPKEMSSPRTNHSSTLNLSSQQEGPPTTAPQGEYHKLEDTPNQSNLLRTGNSGAWVTQDSDPGNPHSDINVNVVPHSDGGGLDGSNSSAITPDPSVPPPVNHKDVSYTLEQNTQSVAMVTENSENTIDSGSMARPDLGVTLSLNVSGVALDHSEDKDVVLVSTTTTPTPDASVPTPTPAPPPGQGVHHGEYTTSTMHPVTKVSTTVLPPVSPSSRSAASASQFITSTTATTTTIATTTTSSTKPSSRSTSSPATVLPTLTSTTMKSAKISTKLHSSHNLDKNVSSRPTTSTTVVSKLAGRSNVFPPTSTKSSPSSNVIINDTRQKVGNVSSSSSSSSTTQKPLTTTTPVLRASPPSGRAATLSTTTASVTPSSIFLSSKTANLSQFKMVPTEKIVTYHISSTANEAPQNHTTFVGDGELSFSAKSGIVAGSIIAFWIILGPFVCIVCRMKEKTTERRDRERDDPLSHHLVEEMIYMELARGREKMYRTHLQNQAEIEKLNNLDEVGSNPSQTGAESSQNLTQNNGKAIFHSDEFPIDTNSVKRYMINPNKRNASPPKPPEYSTHPRKGHSSANGNVVHHCKEDRYYPATSPRKEAQQCNNGHEEMHPLNPVSMETCAIPPRTQCTVPPRVKDPEWRRSVGSKSLSVKRYELSGPGSKSFHQVHPSEPRTHHRNGYISQYKGIPYTKHSSMDTTV